MIPICYSDDWIFTGDKSYETLSVSGGFLGIVIPGEEKDIDISMKFAPKGLDLGLYGTLAGSIIYLGIFTPYWIKKKKNGDDLN